MTIKSVYFALAWGANNRFGRRRLGDETNDANTVSLIPFQELSWPYPRAAGRSVPHGTVRTLWSVLKNSGFSLGRMPRSGTRTNRGSV